MSKYAQVQYEDSARVIGIFGADAYWYKFGNASVANVEKTVWNDGGLGDAQYPWPTGNLVTPQIVSDNAAEAAAGAGVATVRVYGIGDVASMERQEEDVTLTGTTLVELQKTWFRVDRIEPLTLGAGAAASGAFNVGNVSVFTGAETDGVPDDTSQVFTVMPAGLGATKQLFFTVPADKCGVLCAIDASILSTAGKILTFTIRTRTITAGVAGPWREVYDRDADVSLPTFTNRVFIAPGSDVECRAVLSSAIAEDVRGSISLELFDSTDFS